jgi:hypothetical protein
MYMEMIDGLAAVFSCVDDDAIAFGETFLAREVRRDPEQMTEHRRVLLAGFCKRDEMFTRDDQQVNRGLGRNVGEGVTCIVLIFRFGWDASIDNFAEEATHNRISVQERDC